MTSKRLRMFELVSDSRELLTTTLAAVTLERGAVLWAWIPGYLR